MRMQRRHLALALALLAALALPACGGGGSGGGGSTPAPPAPAPTCASSSGSPVTISGTILYERLTTTPGTGLTGPITTRPARFVDVEVRVAGGGACLGRESSSATGTYAITTLVPAGTSIEVLVHSRTLADANRDIEVHNTTLPAFSGNHSGTDHFVHSSGSFLPAANQALDITVPYNPGHPSSRPSIGFNILDVMLTCWDRVQAASAQPMVGVDAYCRLGNNATIGSSFFTTAGNLIAILGGAAGNLDGSDTDYFDDAVIAHEFHHYVELNLSHSWTRGGPHSGELLEPGFSWSEGLATGLGNLCIGTPFYVDSIGTGGGGGGFTWNVEAVGAHVLGIGSEEVCLEVVYDLGDGSAGAPADSDLDGIAVPLADIYGALFTFNPAFDGPYIGLFLDRLVGLSGSLTAGQVTTLMGGTPGDPGAQGITYPLAGADIWPPVLAIPSTTNSPNPIDSLPGANKSQQTGLTSSDWYQFTLAAPATVRIDLSIAPLAGSSDDIDLFLCRNNDILNAIASSTQVGAAPESIGPINLAAGTYVVRVEGFTKLTAVQANYTLTIQ